MDKKIRVLNNTYSDKAVAYCYHHRAGITPKQLKKRQCLARQCKRLKKYEQLPFWEERKQKKELKKANRQKNNPA